MDDLLLNCGSSSRRRFLTGVVAATAGTRLVGAAEQPTAGRTLRIAMIHLEPELAEMDRNSGLAARGIQRAAEAGADWVITPELGLTGYRFDLKIGTSWIQPGPDRWTNALREAARKSRVTLFLGHLEKDPSDGKSYNTAFVIGRDGAILGRHRKINTVQVSEGWSTPAKSAAPIQVPTRHGELSVGVLICADCWPPNHAASLKGKGAEVLLSPATWPPEPHGPETAWEQRTQETGLPLFVCNRTGVERDFDIRNAESIAANGGKRLVRHKSDHSSILVVDWNLETKAITKRSVLPL